MATRKRKLTEEDLRALKRVRELWSDFKKKNPGISQDVAASRAGFGQSAFSQFLLGRVPIRLSPAIKFARLFGVQPSEIRQELAGIGIGYVTGKAGRLEAREPDPGRLSDEALDIATVYDKLAPQTRERFRELIFMFSIVDRHFPWLRRGRPRGESYSQFEERVEQNMEALLTLTAQRIAGKS